VQYNEAPRYAISVKHLWRQHDYTFDQVGADEVCTDGVLSVGLLVSSILLFGLLGLAAEQDALRHHDNCATSWLQRFNNLLHPGKIAVVAWRQAESKPIVWIAAGEIVVSPRFQREGRIHHDAVELT